VLLVYQPFVTPFSRYLIQTKEQSLAKFLPACTAPAARCSQQYKECSALSWFYV